MRFRQERALRVRRSLALEAIRREQDLLSRRPLDLTVDGHVSYVVSRDEIVFRVEGSPAAWRALLPKSGLWWLPLDGLIRQARLVRWQDLGGERVATIGQGQLPVFISHRWLAVDQPDPTGRQARLIAWHLLVAIGEAASIAEALGLHKPRRRSVIASGWGLGGRHSHLLHDLRSAAQNPRNPTPDGAFVSLRPDGTPPRKDVFQTACHARERPAAAI
jgi:hypothetical protein